jgi:hypothetical protein
MACGEIDLKALRNALNAVIDHLIIDLGIDVLRIEEGSDLYWNCPSSELYDVSKKPVGLDIGRLGDDVDFIKMIRRGQSADISYNLVHIAPLLRYIAETVKR